MKNWKRAISLLLCTVMILGMIPPVSVAAADSVTSGTCGDGLTWTLDEAGKLTISGTGAMYDGDTDSAPFWDYRSQIKTIVVEEGVTALCHEAFMYSAVTSVSLPSTLETIGGYAFSYCKVLPEITLPEGVKIIKGSAFHSCDLLESLTIPSTVTELGSPLAESSENLTVITFTGNMPTLGENTFRTGSSSLTVYYPGTDTTWDTDKMKNYGYAGTVQWVPVYATIVDGTCGADLTWVLDEVGTLTISGTGRMSDFYEPMWYDWRDDIKKVRFSPEVTYIGNNSFKDCVNLTDVELPAALIGIGDYAFCGCGSLETIEIPDPVGVMVIGESAFEGCVSLKEIVIPFRVTDIEYKAFADCSSLETIVISNTVKYVAYNAFKNCESLTDIYYVGTKEAWESNSVNLDSELTKVHYDVTDFAEHWAEETKEATCVEAGYTRESCACGYERNRTDIPATGDHTMDENHTCTVCGYIGGTCGKNLTWTLKDGVLTISGTGAMSNYYNTTRPWYSYVSIITSVVIEDGVTSIGNYAFYECRNLSALQLPSDLTNIGEWAFSRCESLKNITLPTNMTGIEKYAFADCKRLVSIEIPAGVTSMENGIFSGCGGLTSVILPAELTNIGEYAFSACYDLKSINISNSVTSIGKSAFFACNSLTHVNIPNGVTIINEHTFYDCFSLTSITIPSSVTFIGAEAFYNCNKLTCITIPKSDIFIGADAFYHCSKLTDVYFGGTAEQWDDLGENVPTATYIHYSCASAEGHWAEETKEATCGEAGYTREICACGYERNRTDILATGEHVFDKEAAEEQYLVSAATCTEQAVYYVSCSVCGAAGEGTFEYGESLGHDMGEWGVVEDPTCTVDGVKRRDCSRCDHFETEVIPAVGHAHEGVVTAPTCTEDGYTTYTCHCGDSYVADPVNKLGHEMGEWEVTKEATPYEEGEKRRDCSRCDHFETEIIPVSGVKLAVMTQPKSTTANVGEVLYFKVTAAGEGLTYQWQYRVSSTDTWKVTTLSGAKTAALKITASTVRNGYQYRCTITDAYGKKATSVAATLTVRTGPTISSQPASVTAVVGQTATFKVAATGEGLTYQWQWRKNSTASWAATTVSGNKTATIKVPATLTRNGYQYRCVVTDAYGNTATSNAATLTVKAGVTITGQPASVTAVVGQTATFKVAATGEGLTYQWQWRKNSTAGWAATTVSGNKTATIKVPATLTRNGYQYRCKVTDSAGNAAYSNGATLTVKAGVTITGQPASVTAVAGNTAAFKVIATGEGLTYQWQWRKNDSAAWAITSVSGNKTATIKVPATLTRNGYQYRCVITDAYGNTATSNGATLTVKAALAITTQPEDVTAAVGDTVTFKVAATGEGLTYQWQWRKNSTASWAATTVSGNKTATIKVPATTARNGYQYRCVITDANGNKITTRAATLTVK